MKSSLKYAAGIFILSFSTLLFELSLSRVFSVTLWYHFGFLIISTALMGFGASGVLLSIWKKFREESILDKTLVKLTIAIALSMLGAFWLLQKIPFDPFSLYADKRQFIYMPITYVLVALPFFFSGLSITLLFTRNSKNFNRLYAFDLVGAALGCIAVVLTMGWFGGGGSVLIAAATSLFGALVFAGKSYMRLSILSLILMASLIWLAIHSDHYIPLRISSNKGNSLKKRKPIYTEWNTFSRIDLYIDSSELAPDKTAPVFIFDQGTAATGLDFDLQPDVNSALKRFSNDSLYPSCVAYVNKIKPDVLVIGSGCGTQVLDALHHGVHHVTAVEINEIINKVVSVKMNNLWGNLFHQPEVTLVTDEGRNYVRSVKEKYDAIISTHTISNAAIASGALSLSENYVLTREAFQDYFDHLKEDGIIYFTRPEFQIPRLFATGREVLAENGITDLRRHFIAFTYPEYKGRKSFYAVFIMSKKALDERTYTKMKSYISASKDEGNEAIMLYDPILTIRNIYDSILTVKNLDVLYRSYPFEISPATDNNPFFNHHTRWSALRLDAFKDIFTQERMGRIALEDKPIAEVSLIILLVQVILVSSLFILLPLVRSTKNTLQLKSAFPYLVYFSGLGCGFIMIEIVLIQQFSLLLGEPVYTFAIVLSALLLFTGLGSYLSGKFSLNSTRHIRNVVLTLAVVLMAASIFLTPLLGKAVALPVWGRILLSLFIIFPIGVLLGIPFPTGIKIISGSNPSLIPWAWGVNGFFTVIGTVVALILSMMIGFQAVLWIAIAIYLFSVGLLIKTTR